MGQRATMFSPGDGTVNRRRKFGPHVPTFGSSSRKVKGPSSPNLTDTSSGTFPHLSCGSNQKLDNLECQQYPNRATVFPPNHARKLGPSVVPGSLESRRVLFPNTLAL